MSKVHQTDEYKPFRVSKSKIKPASNEKSYVINNSVWKNRGGDKIDF